MTDASKPQIAPALTKEEAESGRIRDVVERLPNGVICIDSSGGEYAGVDLDAHKLAALALYKQPFGFTREDVDALRSIQFDGIWGPGSFFEKRGEDLPEAGAWADSLADRIAALLPPEE